MPVLGDFTLIALRLVTSASAGRYKTPSYAPAAARVLLKSRDGLLYHPAHAGALHSCQRAVTVHVHPFTLVSRRGVGT